MSSATSPSGSSGLYLPKMSSKAMRVGYAAFITSTASYTPRQRSCSSTARCSKTPALARALGLTQRTKCASQPPSSAARPLRLLMKRREIELNAACLRDGTPTLAPRSLLEAPPSPSPSPRGVASPAPSFGADATDGETSPLLLCGLAPPPPPPPPPAPPPPSPSSSVPKTRRISGVLEPSSSACSSAGRVSLFFSSHDPPLAASAT